MKICNHCKQELPASQFAHDKTRRDGLMARCKECDSKYSRVKRHKNLARYAAADRRRYEANKLAKLQRLAKWRQENPDKIAAHTEVKMALYHKKIERLPCEVCGNPRTDAHHQDYNKPLEVRWLCRRHHAEV